MTSPKPIQLKLVLVFAAVEVLTAAAVTFFFGYGLLTNQAKDLPILATIIALMLATTIFLASATKALYNLKRWGRSALIFWQFLQISLGWGSIDGKNGILWLGISIFAISGITAILLFSKQVSQAISI
jgi:membrane-associated HD superfamily phosphohydrolase